MKAKKLNLNSEAWNLSLSIYTKTIKYLTVCPIYLIKWPLQKSLVTDAKKMFVLISGENYVYCMTRLGTYLYMKSETIFFIIHRKSYHFYSFQMMQNTEEDEDSPDCHHDYYTIPEGQWLPLLYKQSMNYKKRCTKLKVTVFLIPTYCMY